MPEGKKYLAECMDPTCEWSRIIEHEPLAQALSVCHTVVKHPDKYQEITGKDAAKAEFDYREIIAAFRKDL